MENVQSVPNGLQWLLEHGLQRSDVLELNPCVPGEFTMQNTYYVNSGSPGIVYRGTEEGTLPMVAGRWYLIPAGIIGRYGSLTRDAVPVARAVRLVR